MKNLQILPQLKDSLSYLYVEHARIDQEDQTVSIHDQHGRICIPAATLTLLMLGPGTAITHAAIKTLADVGCLVAWCGEEAVRMYAQGLGETRSAARLLWQAKVWADLESRMKVAATMYRLRFKEDLPPELSIAELRGHEGVRVRTAYQKASAEFGILWEGRSYERTNWHASDPVNRALSAANSCLYGICHAAILSAGFSPAIGFIHTGKMLSFVYDIADLYKTELTIPVAFRIARDGSSQVESRVRRALRDHLREIQLLDRIIVDIEHVLNVESNIERLMAPHNGQDDALPSALWDPAGTVEGGLNHGTPRRPAATETLEVEHGRDHSRAG